MRVFASLALVAALLFSPVPTFAANSDALSSGDLVLVTRKDANGVGTPGAVTIDKISNGTGVGYTAGAGSFKITSFTTGGTTTEQPVFNFSVVKGAAS